MATSTATITVKKDGPALVEIGDKKWAACVDRKQCDAAADAKVFAPLGVADKNKGECGFTSRRDGKAYASCAGIIRCATLGVTSVSVSGTEIPHDEVGAMRRVSSMNRIAITIKGAAKPPKPTKGKPGK